MNGQEIMLLSVAFGSAFFGVMMAERIWRKRAEWQRTCALIASVMDGRAARF